MIFSSRFERRLSFKWQDLELMEKEPKNYQEGYKIENGGQGEFQGITYFESIRKNH